MCVCVCVRVCVCVCACVCHGLLGTHSFTAALPQLYDSVPSHPLSRSLVERRNIEAHSLLFLNMLYILTRFSNMIVCLNCVLSSFSIVNNIVVYLSCLCVFIWILTKCQIKSVTSVTITKTLQVSLFGHWSIVCGCINLKGWYTIRNVIY